MGLIGVSGKLGSGKDTVGQIIQYLTDDLNKTNPKNYNEWVDGGFHASNWKVKKFAGKLKQIVALLTGCTIEDLESQEFKMKELGPEWNTYGIVRGNDNLGRQVAVQATPHLKDSIWLASGDNQQVENILTYRKLLQVIGTDALRNVVHENIWVNALMADYVEKTNHNFRVPREEYVNAIYPNWIITDMRFPNEMEAVEKRGGITIRVNRPYTTTGGNGIPATFSQTQFHPSETSLNDHIFDYVIDNDGSLSDLVEKVRTILIKEKLI